MYRVAVVGATGAVGRELLSVLEARAFPVGSLVLLASSRSAGTRLRFRGAEAPVSEVTDAVFDRVDVAFFAAGKERSRRFGPVAARAGALVVDNSSAFRMDPDVPLVIPEVNGVAAGRGAGIVANPNCSTILLVVALAPLHRVSRIRRIVVATYQAVSGVGWRGIAELDAQVAARRGDDRPPPVAFPKPIAYNVIPFVEAFEPNGSTVEETKIARETRKILGDPEIGVTATCVRVPVARCHSEAVHVETAARIGAAQARRLLAAAPGVRVLDDPARGLYPTPLECEGRPEVFVGRIRDDEAAPNALNLWIVADQLLKGAALNAVQIAEQILGVPAPTGRDRAE